MTGDLREVDGKFIIRFERHMTHADKEVWDFITLSAKTLNWLADATIDLVEGGEIVLRFSKSTEEIVQGIIRTLDPPRVFTHTWNTPGSFLRWELDGDDEGCTVVLTHTLESKKDMASIMASWHLHIDALSFALAGVTIDWPHDRWQELQSKYGRMFG